MLFTFFDIKLASIRRSDSDWSFVKAGIDWIISLLFIKWNSIRTSVFCAWEWHLNCFMNVWNNVRIVLSLWVCALCHECGHGSVIQDLVHDISVPNESDDELNIKTNTSSQIDSKPRTNGGILDSSRRAAVYFSEQIQTINKCVR